MNLINFKRHSQGNEKISIPQGKEKFEFVYSYALVKLIQIMIKD